MAKATNDIVMDASLDKLAEADNLNVCSAQPLTYYEAIDPSAWQAGLGYILGDAARPTIRNGYAYEVTTAGTSGASEPAWPTVIGATVVDGGVTWTCRANYNLAAGALITTDFTKANGDISGRKTTVAAKTGLGIHTTGTATHVATADDATKVFLDVTTCTSQGLTSGGTVDTPAWDHEIQDPV